MTRRTLTALCVAAVAAGVVLRGASVSWNAVVAHGDVHMDASAAASLVRYGRLLTYEEGNEGGSEEEGKVLVQHGPLWPALGAAATLVRGGARNFDGAYLSLRLLSFVSGLLLLALSWALARKFLSVESAWIAAAWMSLTFLLADYSGNGSFYSLQACIYVAWAIAAMWPASLASALALGALSGGAYLLNFQSIVLFPATLVVTLVKGGSRGSRLGLSASALGVGLLVASPWLVRNALLFGDPLRSHAVNQTYLFIKAGMNEVVDGDVARPSLLQWLAILPGIAAVWLPNNLYYVLRKLLVLAPVASIVAAFGAVDVALCPRRFLRIWPVLLVAGSHLLISAAWPVMKFRYFVPLLPFVFLLALEQLEETPISAGRKRAVAGLVAAAIVLVSALTYRAVPTHTTYYDGAVTQDAYHGSEERTYLEARGLIPSR